jgi:putative transposase
MSARGCTRFPPHIGQSALRDLNTAFERFFKGWKGDAPKSGYPRFKKRGERDSASVYEVALEERHIRLPNIGRVRMKETRSKRGFQGRILLATIRRRADRWFVLLCVMREREIIGPRPVKKLTDIVGVDLGEKTAAVIHDSAATRVIEPSQALRRRLKKLRRLNRQLARRQESSHNREKAKLELARLHYKISSSAGSPPPALEPPGETKSVILLEDLHVRGMQRNKYLALSIGDAGMGELRRQLEYKSDCYGATLIIAHRLHPSTQLRSSCGVRNESVKGFEGLKQRTFDCSACGLSLDRDENAGLNLRAYGLHHLGIVPLPEGLREVRPVGEDGSGPTSRRRVKPASAKQEASVTRRKPRRATQRREETLAGAATSWA